MTRDRLTDEELDQVAGGTKTSEDSTKIKRVSVEMYSEHVELTLKEWDA